MELSHVISEVVLAGVGIFVFFSYLSKLNLIDCLLWEAFVLTVAITALLGAVRFAGHTDIIPVHTFFQQLASSVGVISLVLAAFTLVSQKPLSKTVIYSIWALGFLGVLLVNILGYYKVFAMIPQVCIPLMMAIGFWAIFKGLRNEGIFILLGTIFAVLATFNKALNLPIDSTDAYHYLLAIALLCFGLAAKRGISVA